MTLMVLLKIIFVIMLCVPVAYLCYWLTGLLIEQLKRQTGNDLPRKSKGRIQESRRKNSKARARQ